MRLDQPYVRGSADGFLIFNPNGDETQYCIPVEVKARVSPNTFHCTVARFNKRQNLADLPGVGWDGENNVRKISIDSDSPHLLGMVPESYDLFQILHHAYTYSSKNCYYLIIGHIKLFYIMFI